MIMMKIEENDSCKISGLSQQAMTKRSSRFKQMEKKQRPLHWKKAKEKQDQVQGGSFEGAWFEKQSDPCQLPTTSCLCLHRTVVHGHG